ncbi:MAG TPA: hypothetical protein PKZ42_08880 [Syntrophales bacterium]|nr:hypothetical protein [Syntrophales bacterium]
MNRPFQRKGSKSNTHVGKEFEETAMKFFKGKGLFLQNNISVNIGVNEKRPHSFDLGSLDERILVECKSHTWTEGGNVPSAKMTTWDQAMYFFHIAPKGHRKIFFVLKDYSTKKRETLAEYYIRTKSHLIPLDVEIWEFDETQKNGKN